MSLVKTLLFSGIALIVGRILRSLDARDKASVRPAIETWENEGGAPRTGNVPSDAPIRPALRHS